MEASEITRSGGEWGLGEISGRELPQELWVDDHYLLGLHGIQVYICVLVCYDTFNLNRTFCITLKCSKIFLAPHFYHFCWQQVGRRIKILPPPWSLNSASNISTLFSPSCTCPGTSPCVTWPLSVPNTANLSFLLCQSK